MIDEGQDEEGRPEGGLPEGPARVRNMEPVLSRSSVRVGAPGERQPVPYRAMQCLSMGRARDHPVMDIVPNKALSPPRVGRGGEGKGGILVK